MALKKAIVSYNVAVRSGIKARFHKFRGIYRPYIAILTADLHTDADPYRDRTDVLRRAFAGITHKYGKTDAFVMAGDITNCGDEKEYALLRKLLKHYICTDKCIPSLGNHDSWHHSDHPCFEIAYRLFRDFCVSCGINVTENYYLYSDRKCNYIVLGTEKTMHNSAFISEKQLEWFEKQLEAVNKKNKVTVIINHQTLHDRNGGENSWAEEGQLEVSMRIEELLLRFSKTSCCPVVFVSGHKHSLKNVIQKECDKLYFVNLPSLEYGGENDVHPGSGVTLKIDPDNNVSFDIEDYITGEMI